MVQEHRLNTPLVQPFLTRNYLLPAFLLDLLDLAVEHCWNTTSLLLGHFLPRVDTFSRPGDTLNIDPPYK